MAYLTVHFDDSGTDRESPIAVAACCVSTVPQWKEFERNWSEANADLEFGVFHSSDFSAANKFRKPKSERLVKRLCNIATTRSRAMFGIAVKKTDYDEVVTGPFREYAGHFHYTFAVRWCCWMIAAWREKYHSRHSMQYVFDRMTQGKHEIIDVMDRARNTSEEEARHTGVVVLDGYSFEDKAKVVPLQAADMLAWTVYRQMQELNKNRPMSWVASEMMDGFLRSGVHMKVSYFTKEELVKWRQAECAELARRLAARADISKAVGGV
jgi:hypothetical protein